MIKLLKKLFAWLFGSKPTIEKEEPSFEQFAQEKPFSKPEPLPKKKKKQVNHKISPEYFTMPRNFSYRRGLGHVQQIVAWDGEHFPGRWRTRLIYHN